MTNLAAFFNIVKFVGSSISIVSKSTEAEVSLQSQSQIQENQLSQWCQKNALDIFKIIFFFLWLHIVFMAEHCLGQTSLLEALELWFPNVFAPRLTFLKNNLLGPMGLPYNFFKRRSIKRYIIYLQAIISRRHFNFDLPMYMLETAGLGLFVSQLAATESDF